MKEALVPNPYVLFCVFECPNWRWLSCCHIFAFSNGEPYKLCKSAVFCVEGCLNAKYYFLRSLCAIGGDCFFHQGIFLRELKSQRKIPRSKTITDELTQWPQNRWCKVIIVIDTCSLHNLMHFWSNSISNILWNLFLTRHVEPMLVWCFKRKLTRCSWHHKHGSLWEVIVLW